jgi:hypothetical protein
MEPLNNGNPDEVVPVLAASLLLVLLEKDGNRPIDVDGVELVLVVSLLLVKDGNRPADEVGFVLVVSVLPKDIAGIVVSLVGELFTVVAPNTYAFAGSVVDPLDSEEVLELPKTTVAVDAVVVAAVEVLLNERAVELPNVTVGAVVGVEAVVVETVGVPNEMAAELPNVTVGAVVDVEAVDVETVEVTVEAVLVTPAKLKEGVVEVVVEPASVGAGFVVSAVTVVEVVKVEDPKLPSVDRGLASEEREPNEIEVGLVSADGVKNGSKLSFPLKI